MKADKPKVPYTLLLADDSVTIQRVIELTFADEDVRVVAVSDGGEAIAWLDKTPPDIVLADVGMPGQNGYEVARHIKATPRLAHIPVVLLTGAFEPIDQAKVAEIGCDGVLAKPFEPQLVIARVKELLARPKGMEDSKDTPGTVDAGTTDDTQDLPDTKDSAPAPGRSWAQTPEDGPPRDRASHAAAVADIDDYFDRLGAALSKQEKTPPAEEASLTETRSTRPGSWFDAPNDVALTAPADFDEYVAPILDRQFEELPLSSSRAESATPDVGQEEPLSEPPPPPVFPPLADAFAALLAAEQSGSGATAIPTWPVTTVTPLPASPPPTVPDDIVEQVTRRVLAELSDRVVRETVKETVLATAERLVKEEIERLKGKLY